MPLPQPPSLIPSHRIAVWLLDKVQAVLAAFGLDDNLRVQEIVYAVIVAVVAYFIGWVLKNGILLIVRKIVKVRHSQGGAELLREHTLSRCAHIVPPLVFMALIPIAFNTDSHLLDIIMRLVGVYTLIALAVGLCAVATYIFNRYNKRDNTQQRPIQGVLNIAKGLIWIVVVILSVSVLIDKSPGALLAGLGAFAAALMLIFRDSILGFVAGIQMSQNDMVHVGDWIMVPSTPANGTVIDVSLSTVKIQNFDNTIITVPPYTLVQGAFQNYDGMYATGVRNICQTFTIEYATINPCTEAMLEAAAKEFPVLGGFIAGLAKEHATAAYNPGTRLVNGTVDTNVGLWRAYLCEYLCNHPRISKQHRVLVQTCAPTHQGLPVQIWCFADTTDWNAYEAIISDVTEHIAASMRHFGLAPYSAAAMDVDVDMASINTNAAPGAPTSPAPTPRSAPPSPSGH